MDDTSIVAFSKGNASRTLLFQEKTGAIRRVDYFAETGSWKALADSQLQLDVVARNNKPLTVIQNIESEVSTSSLSHSSNSIKLRLDLTDV